MTKRHRRVSIGAGLVIAIVGMATVAFAATSPLLITVLMSGAGLDLDTNVLPKGWFNGPGGGFDPTKTTLVTRCALAETSCSAPATELLNSSTDGGFTPSLNPAGQVVGYGYSLYADLSAHENHWSYHFRCDGSVEVVGCDQAIPVTVETTAYSSPGVCRTYVDAGVTRCASDTRFVTLPAVQDGDIIEVCEEGDGCGIGPCVSACERDCHAIANREARRECQKACVCDCKVALGCGDPECD